MKCSECGMQEMILGTQKWVCEACGARVAIKESKKGHGALERIVPGLPNPLAVLVDEYLKETNPYIKLHRLCDASEMLTRFLAMIGIAEVERALEGGLAYEPALRSLILERIRTPTFGVWVDLLEQTRRLMVPFSKLLIPEISDYAEIVIEAVRPPNATAGSAILPLRNALAHSNRFSEEQSVEFLDARGHGERFENLLLRSEAAFLRETELVGVSGEGGVKRCVSLTGAILPPPGMFPHYEGVTLKPDPRHLEVGTVLVTRYGAWLELTPLQTFGPVLRRGEGSVEVVDSDSLVSQIYTRSDEFGPQFTAFHRSLHSGYADKAIGDSFQKLFPLENWRRLDERRDAEKTARDRMGTAAKKFRFRDVWERYKNEPFVGRAKHIEEAIDWLCTRDSGGGIILGLPGMGKTAFMLHLSNLLKRRQSSWLCFRHFFRGDDALRCSRRSFLSGILYQLGDLGLIELDEGLEDLQVKALEERFFDALNFVGENHLGEGRKHSKVVFLIDGLDELAKSDGGFQKLLRGIGVPGVIWLASARAEEAILRELRGGSPERLTFTVNADVGSGDVASRTVNDLPGLDRRAVREYLLTQLDRTRYGLLREEVEVDAFLDQVTRRAESLPLYLVLLANDLRLGTFAVERPHELPNDLAQYYDALIERVGLDSARDLVQIYIALLAVAKTPMPESMVQALLGGHHLRRDNQWEALFARAVRYGRVLTRQGYLWEGENGHTLYHESFREHLLRTERDDSVVGANLMAPSIRDARRRFVSFVLDWRRWPKDSYERNYAIRFGPLHLIEEERWNLLVGRGDERGLLTDFQFIEEKSEAGLSRDLVSDFGMAMEQLPENLWEVARRAELKEAMRRHHCALIDYARRRYEWKRAGERGEWRPKPSYPIVPEPVGSESMGGFPEEGSERAHRLRRFANFVSRHAGFIHEIPSATLACAYNEGGLVSDPQAVAKGLSPQAWLRREPKPVTAPLRPAVVRDFEYYDGGIRKVFVTPDGKTAILGSDDNALGAWDLENGECVGLLPGVDLGLCAVSMSQDCRYAIMGGLDDGIPVLNLQSGELVRVLDGDGSMVHSVKVSADGRRAVSGGFENRLRVWDFELGAYLGEIECESPFIFDNYSLTPDGLRVVVADLDALRVCDLEDGRCLCEIEQKGVGCLDVSPDGRFAISGQHPDFVEGDAASISVLRIWDLETGVCRGKLEGHEGWARIIDIRISPDGCSALSAASDDTVRLWDLESGQCSCVFPSPVDYLVGDACLAFCPEGTKFIFASGCNARLWNIEGATNVTSSSPTVAGAGFIKLLSGRRVVTRCWEGRDLLFWDLETGRCSRRIDSGGYRITDLIENAEGNMKAVGTGDNKVAIIDLDLGEPVTSLELHDQWVRRLWVSDEGDRCVSCCSQKVRLWKLHNGESLQIFNTEYYREFLEVTPDGGICVTEGEDCLDLWALRSGHHFTLSLQEDADESSIDNSAVSLAVSPGGHHLLCRKTIRLEVWDLVAKRRLYTRECGENHCRPSMSSAIFEPRGRMVIYLETDIILVVEAGSQNELSRMCGHSGWITALAVSPSGNVVVSGGNDKTVRAWDIKSGECLAVYYAGATIDSIAIPPEGGQIVCTSEDGQIHFLKMENFPPYDEPIVTADPIELGPLFASVENGDSVDMARCPMCNSRFELPLGVRGTIRHWSRPLLGTSASQILALPDEAFSDPRLRGECPECGKGLRFNPYFVHQY